MLVFGHLGIGLKLAQPWRHRLQRRYILLGTVVPDLLDKFLYYGVPVLIGKKGAGFGIILGTRSIGHTALLLICLTGIAVMYRLRVLGALCIGMATHLLLDNIGDRIVYLERFRSITDGEQMRGVVDRAILWPLQGWDFPYSQFNGIADHIPEIGDHYYYAMEILGLGFLLWEARKLYRLKEISWQKFRSKLD